jgi:hypothetical protein
VDTIRGHSTADLQEPLVWVGSQTLNDPERLWIYAQRRFRPRIALLVDRCRLKNIGIPEEPGDKPIELDGDV